MMQRSSAQVLNSIVESGTRNRVKAMAGVVFPECHEVPWVGPAGP